MLGVQFILVFEGSGSVTLEHETVARYLKEASVLRKKYYGGRGMCCVLPLSLDDDRDKRINR